MRDRADTADKLNRIRDLVKGIDSGVSILDMEGKFLYTLARKNNIGSVVEIGSWKGRSTIWLAQACMDKLKEEGEPYLVYAIDPHTDTDTHEWESAGDTHKEFINNLEKAGVRETVRPIRLFSEDAIKRAVWKERTGETKIGLLFIDGNHSYKSVKFDFDNWTKFLVPGSVVALHDTVTYEGPKRIVTKDILGNPNWKFIGMEGQVVAARRVSPSRGVYLNHLFWGSYFILYSLLFLLAKRLPKRVRERLKE